MKANPGILVAHPTGNQNVRNVLRALQSANCLNAFVTGLAFADEGQASIAWLKRAVEARIYSLPKEKLKTVPTREILRIFASRIALRNRMFDKVFTSDAVYRSVDFAASRALQRDANRIDAIYAYEDCAAQGFQMAHKLGIQCIYDLPIAYWETAQKLYQEESERWPDWVPTMPGLRDQKEKLDRKSVELELADVVICPSEFVANSIASSAIARRMQKKTVVIPFGSPSEAVSVADRPSRGPLNVLFVGSMTQRKGLADLFQAVRILGRSDVRLTVMGAPISALNFYRERLPSLIHEPPRSHREVLALMDKTDVLVLPSIVEGRALVVQEAMSRGLPVIVTPNTGASDLVREGVNGFIIPIRSPEMIADRLAWMADHRDLVLEMGRHSRESSDKASWAEYREGVETLVNSLVLVDRKMRNGQSPTPSAGSGKVR